MSDCCICIEPFNKTVRKRIECPYCPTDGTASPCCNSCVKKYLLQDDAPTPRCPSCRSGWTEDYMTQTFAKTWLLKQYKEHREHVLLDMERARLPEAQEDAVRYRNAQQIVRRIHELMNPYQAQLAALPEVQAEKDAEAAYRLVVQRRQIAERETFVNTGVQQRNDALRTEESAAWHALMNARTHLRNARTGILRQMNALRTEEYTQANRIYAAIGREVDATRPIAESRETRHWTFVMKCPLEACEGFVGMNWKCGLCEVQFCKECGDRQTEGHLCDPETCSTHQALRKEAKPCPKCAAMISKIDGCDQMWCTQCQTAFSWRTGQIETSHVHNPHYFQWMRQNGGAPAPRPIGDCLNLTPQELLDQVIHYARRRHHWPIVEWARLIRHFMWIQRQHQYTLRERQNDDWRRQLRVKRLVGEITDDVWKDRLQRGEKATQKEFALVQIMDLFIEAGTDQLRNTLADDAPVAEIQTQLDALRKFCNDEMTKIQKRFNNQVEYIQEPSEFSGHM